MGRYPVEAVEVMDRIAREVESHGPATVTPRAPHSDPGHNLARAAARLAGQVQAKAILAFTRTGLTAKLLSKERPGVPTYGFTANRSIFNRLALWQGVVPLMGRSARRADSLIEFMMRGAPQPGARGARRPASSPCASRGPRHSTWPTSSRSVPYRGCEKRWGAGGAPPHV